ncbi:FanG protein [Streptococcus agalactiae]|uniref:FanG protein n=1 Tax=Streptococcus agalactiae TaxID=1311 RepID=UPI0011D082BA|nr:FanG protein [Streptococcus agalactiae]
MYSNIKLCRCQLKIHQNIDNKLVYQILKSPAIEMIAGLNSDESPNDFGKNH